MVKQCCHSLQTLFVTGRVNFCKVLTLLSAVGVLSHCYCHCVYTHVLTLHILYSSISKQQTNNSDGFFIVTGDVNQVKTVLQKFYQHANFAKRRKHWTWCTQAKNKGKILHTTALPRPHLRYSDHIFVMLIPAYRPLLKLAKPVQKHITVWSEDAASALQDCFQDINWNV